MGVGPNQKQFVSRRAVFVDRDGTLNRAVVVDGKPYPPSTIGEFELLPGVREGLVSLKAAGYLVVVVTNQPDVATGRQSSEVVDAMHTKLRSKLPIDDIRVCFHTDEDGCGCRKPLPGMLLAAADELGIDLSSSYMVGDRWRDIEAGQAAGCRTIFIRSGYTERQPEQYDLGVDSFAAASLAIIGQVTQ